jgi:chemotaxis protein MotB
VNESARNRRPCYLQQSTVNQDRWMISYTDVVTILLILFIAIALKASQVRPIVGLPLKAPVPHHQAYTPAPALSLAQATLQKRGVALKMEQRGLVITLPQAVLFATGEDSIRTEALPMIKEIANVLRELDNKVLLVGHADTTPIRNQHFRNNWELSAARSMQLLTVLTEQCGLPEARFTVASDGSYSPTVPNDSEEGRARNRRVEIVILEDTFRSAM